SLHPLHIRLGSRGLRHDDASVLTKRSGLDSRREFQRVGSVTEQHGSVRSCKSGFDSRPAHHIFGNLEFSWRIVVGRPPEMRTWVPWSEVAQKPRGTLDEFHALLRKYPRSALLRIYARLSVFFNYGPDA